MRFDYVKRVDEVKDITRQKSWTVQPRLGATYLLTQDAKNVLRASYARLGEQVMGRDGVTIFGADDTVSFRREYDNDLDGVFETDETARAGVDRPPWPRSRSRPACISRTSTSSSWDTAGSSAGRLVWMWRYINRAYKDMWANIDINGFYPDGPGLPFRGFGKVDPNQGISPAADEQHVEPAQIPGALK